MPDFTKDLIPSEDEISQILTQTMKENPSHYLVVVLQIELARFMVKSIDRLKTELDESIRRMEDTLDNK